VEVYDSSDDESSSSSSSSVNQTHFILLHSPDLPKKTYTFEISNDDLKRIKTPTKWFNDTIINAYILSCCDKYIDTICVLHSLFFKQDRGERLVQLKQTILHPWNIDDVHWVLLMFDRKSGNTYDAYVLDSMETKTTMEWAMSVNAIAKKIKQRKQMFVYDPNTLRVLQPVIQKDSYNCGPYVCQFVEFCRDWRNNKTLKYDINTIQETLGYTKVSLIRNNILLNLISKIKESEQKINQQKINQQEKTKK